MPRITVSIKSTSQIECKRWRVSAPYGTVVAPSVYGPIETCVDYTDRTVSRVDPVRHVIGGYYKAAYYSDLFGSLNTNLTFKARYGAPETYYRNVTGLVSSNVYDVIGLKTNLTWNRPYLINNVLKGILNKSFDLAVFLRELNQTMSLISSTARKLSKSVDEIKKRQFTRAAKTLGIKKPEGVSSKKHWSDNYLAYKFGVMPLIADVDGSMKYLATMAERVRIRASSRLSTSVDKVKVYSKVYFNAGYEEEFTVTSRCSYKTFVFEQVTAEYRLSNNFWRQLQRLGITNGATATWESIPYSFVVDTFVNIGECLGDLDLGLGLEFVTSSYTQGRRISGTSTAVGSFGRLSNSYKDYVLDNRGSTPGKFEDYLMERLPLTEADMTTTLMFRSPLSVNNAINDVALVVQRSSK